MNVCPITILFRRLVSSFSPSLSVLLVQTPSTSSRFVISSSPWRTGGRSKGPRGPACHSHPCVLDGTAFPFPLLPPNSPSSSDLYTSLLNLLGPAKPVLASSVLQHGAWRMTRGHTHPHMPTRTPSPSQVPKKGFMLMLVRMNKDLRVTCNRPYKQGFACSV